LEDSTERGSDSEIAQIAQLIVDQIEKTSSKDLAGSDEMNKILHLTDPRHAKKLLQNIDQASTRSERSAGKKAVIEALLISTRLQRLYFVIRSIIMGLFSSIITFSFILYFGSINVTLGILLGLLSFTFSLVISRLFDLEIVKATKGVVAFLNGHKALRNFVLNHF
jgi:hypothetical protein